MAASVELGRLFGVLWGVIVRRYCGQLLRAVIAGRALLRGVMVSKIKMRLFGLLELTAHNGGNFHS
jgi:hypothetical protein